MRLPPAEALTTVLSADPNQEPASSPPDPLFDVAPIPSLICTPAGEIVRANPAMTTLLALESAANTINWLDLVDPDDTSVTRMVDAGGVLDRARVEMQRVSGANATCHGSSTTTN